MLIALTTLFLLTAISFAVVVMALTLRESWGKVMVALVPVYSDAKPSQSARHIRRITRRPATLRTIPVGLRAAA